MMLRALALLALVPLAPLASGQDRRALEVPAAQEPTFPVEVRFDVQRGSWSDAVPAPGVVVELGVGRKGDAPLHLDRPVLARVTSDELGHIHETLEVPERWQEDADARVWARVATAGLTRRVVLRHLRGNEEPTRLIVHEGGTLCGTVRDGAGTPVPGASVSLFPLEKGEPRRGWQARADEGGRFAVLHFVVGTFDLHAHASGRGSGSLRSLDLDPRVVPDPVEVTIGGGLPVHGRVLDPAGEPVAGLTVTAVPVEGFPDERARFLGESGGGVRLDRTTTDREGRFALLALAAGSYTLHARYLPESPLTRRITERFLGDPVGTFEVPGTEPLELVHRVHRIEVTVVDGEGAAVDPATAVGKSRRENGPVLQVLPLADGQVSSWLGGFPPTLVDGVAIYPAEPDREYLLAWQQSGIPYHEVRARVDWHRFRVPVRIELGRPVEDASLTVRVVDPAGREYVGATIRVRDPGSGREVATTVYHGLGGDYWRQDPTWEVALPPGRYRIDVDSSPRIGCVVPHPYPREPHMPTSVMLELLAGEDRTVDARLGAAGHLDLEPLDPLPPLTREESRQLVPGAVISAEVRQAARSKLGGASVVLVSASGDRRPVSRYETPGLELLAFDGVDWIVPGWSARCLEPLPVGAWTLRIERGDELLLERPVTIEAGRVTTVRW